MSSNLPYSIEYSEQALKNAIEISDYISENFSEKEVKRFFLALLNFEKRIVVYPLLYPISKQINARRAVISRELSLFYTIRFKTIFILTIIDNRWVQRV
jgi:plasmid stabilization system protein ParE